MESKGEKVGLSQSFLMVWDPQNLEALWFFWKPAFFPLISINKIIYLWSGSILVVLRS